MVSLAKILKKMENNKKQPHEIYSINFYQTSCDGCLSDLFFKTLKDGEQKLGMNKQIFNTNSLTNKTELEAVEIEICWIGKAV